MNNHNRNQNGSTFIELVAAVSVFAVVTVGLSPALLNARKAADFGKNQSIAATLAEDNIEQIRSDGLTGTTCTTATNLQADGSAGGIFTRACTTAAGPITGTTRVAITVSWRDR